MAPALEISIPTTSISPASTATNNNKPVTLYHITTRHPLRSHTFTKRYSDFAALHAALIAQSPSHTPPPAPLPPKSWLPWATSTITSPARTEQRRAGLEAYLRAINSSSDAQWRSCAAWRAFLGLTGGAALLDSGDGGGFAVAAAQRRLDAAAGSMPITDQVVWLDTHRDLKAQLRDVRALLAKREQEGTSQGVREVGVEAKSGLVRSGVMINALERGLLVMSAGEVEMASKLSSDEVRRRKDLLVAAKKERDGLETLLSSVAVRGSGAAGAAGGLESATATAADKNGLLNGQSRANAPTNVSRSGRVLGAPLKETERTRELDNAGVLKLQQQIMAEQDSDVLDLTKAVQRMKEMGIQINDELAAHDELLKILDQDVERVGDKITVAKKKVGNIK